MKDRPPSCLICGEDTTDLATFAGLPVLCNRLAASEAEARGVARGDVNLTACQSCGHIFNRSFNPALLRYDERYENSLHFSRHYNAYADATIRRLVERYGLVGKKIVEIGCGAGDFLRMLCSQGANTARGFEPSRDGIASENTGNGSMEVLGRPFTAADAFDADLVCSRHVLEHLANPMELLRQVRHGLAPSSTVYFEVPNGLFVVDGLSVWDVIYEHISYFTPTSLEQAFVLSGFSPRYMDIAFGGQFLWIEATPCESGAATDERSHVWHREARTPARDFAAVVNHWRDRIRQRAHNGNVVLWGAGSKGITFLNMLSLFPGAAIDHVVDLNPRKHGRFVPGTGQKIVPPSLLPELSPDAVLVMNPEYEAEITEALRSMRLECEVIVVKKILDANRRPAVD